MDYYHFYQQCEDDFETAEAKGHKRVSFAALFLCRKIYFCWQQYKFCIEQEKANLVTWEEFKTFLKKSLGDLTLFVDNIWSKIKRDSWYQQEKI